MYINKNTRLKLARIILDLIEATKIDIEDAKMISPFNINNIKKMESSLNQLETTLNEIGFTTKENRP